MGGSRSAKSSNGLLVVQGDKVIESEARGMLAMRTEWMGMEDDRGREGVGIGIEEEGGGGAGVREELRKG